MPDKKWKVRKRGEQYCVVKLNEDGSEENVSGGCHATKQEADDHAAALYVHAGDDVKNNKTMSLGEQMDQVREAFRAAHPMGQLISGSDMWVVDVFEDHVIIESNGEYFKVSYSKEGEEIIFSPREEWTEVERQTDWITKSIQAQLLIAGRNPLKSIAKTDDELRIANYMILFGDAKHTDLEGQWFTTETEVESDYTRTGTLYEDFEHGFGKAVDGIGPDGEDILGRVDWKSMKKDDIGIWVERVLDRRNKYVQAIEPLIEAGLMGTSSQAVPGKVKAKKSGEITAWPLRRDSLTVMPAEARMMTENVIGALKSLAKAHPELEALLPEGAAGAVPVAGAKQKDGASQNSKSISIKEQSMKTKEEHLAEFAKVMGIEDPGKLTDEQKAIAFRGTEFEEKEPTLDSLAAQMKALSASVQEVLRYAEGSPAINKAGYISQDGGESDKEMKSFGDFLQAIARGDTKRLTKVYKSHKALGDPNKALGESEGPTGGWTVPTEFEENLLKMSDEASQLRNLVTVVPVNSPRGEWPALNQFVAPALGQGESAYAGGVKAAQTAENAELSETEPSFEQIKWQVEKVGGVTKASNELINDSPIAIETMLNALFALAIAAKREHYIFRGNGAGEPLGILNAPCAIGVAPVTNSVFALADATAMLSRFKRFLTPGSWAIHPGIIPDLSAFQIGTGGVALIRDIQSDDVLGLPLLGKPVRQSEHLPQDDFAGCVVLGDMKAYLLFERRGMEIAFSEHAAFTKDQGTWRFYQRLDGQPWLKNAITLADPQGSYTVSPFVYFND